MLLLVLILGWFNSGAGSGAGPQEQPILWPRSTVNCSLMKTVGIWHTAQGWIHIEELYMGLGVWVAPSAVPPSTPLMGIIVKSSLHRQGPALCHGADTALWGTNPTFFCWHHWDFPATLCCHLREASSDTEPFLHGYNLQ